MHSTTCAGSIFLGRVDNNAQSLDEALLGVVEIRERDWEIKDVDEFICLILDGLRQVDEVLVHHEGLLYFARTEGRESLQHLRDVVVVDAIDFHQVLEQHEDKVREQSRLLAEVGVLEHVEDLSAHPLEELIVAQDLSSTQRADLLGELLAGFGEHVGLEAGVHVVFDVVGVRLRDLHVHFDVVLVVRVLLLVGMQQVLVLLKVLDDFAVDADVLQGPVDNDEHLHVDGPVVQVRDVPLQDELERADGRDLLFVLAVQTFEQD